MLGRPNFNKALKCYRSSSGRIQFSQSKYSMLETLNLFVSFLFFVCRVTTVSSVNNGNYLVDSAFKAINFGKAVTNAALHGSILKTVLVTSEFHCQMECVSYQTCLSYNFDTTFKQVGHLCELNGKDRFLRMLHFNRTVKGYLYRGVKVTKVKLD